MRKSRKIFSWNTAKFLLALGLFFFVFRKIDFAYIPLLRERISWAWVILRVLIFSLLLFIKAFQYYALIKNIRYKDVLNIVVWQNTISNFISNSAGIASYITMLKTEQKVRITRSGITFIIVKFGDLLAIVLYLCVSAAMVWQDIQALQWVTVLLIISIFTGLGIFVAAILWREHFSAIIRRIIFWGKLDRFSLILRGLDFLDSLAREEQAAIFSMMRTGVFTSLAYMTVTMLYEYTVVGIFALPINMWESTYVMSLMQLISFVPVQVLGGLGISEVTTVYLYGILGIDPVEMATVVLGTRALFFLMNAGAFFYIPISMIFKRHRTPKDVADAN